MEVVWEARAVCNPHTVMAVFVELSSFLVGGDCQGAMVDLLVALPAAEYLPLTLELYKNVYTFTNTRWVRRVVCVCVRICVYARAHACVRLCVTARVV